MRRKKLLRQVAAAAVALSMAVSLSAPAFAATFDLSNGGLVITAGESGITVTQDGQTGSTSVSYDDTIEIKGSYSSPNGAALTAEENQQDENQPVTPAKAPAKASAKEETPKENSEETSGAENAPAAEEKQEQKDTENLTDPEQKTETENKDNNSDPADEEKKEQNAPANGELNASAGEGQESKAEDEDKPKTEAKASAEASTSASDDASNGSRKAPARSSGEKSEIRGIIQIFANTLVKLTLKDATIDQPNAADTSVRGRAAIDIQGSGDVEITVKGYNTLKGCGGDAGIQKNDNVSTGTLTITAEDTNQTLNVSADTNGAAIGGNGYSGDSHGTKNIVIKGGTVNTQGRIGSGWNGGSAENIVITGDAVVDANGGIGAGACGTGEVIIGGKAQVKATGSAEYQEGSFHYGAGAAIGDSGTAVQGSGTAQNGENKFITADDIQDGAKVEMTNIGHNGSNTVTQTRQNGEWVTKCSNHEFVETTVDPTCTESGYTVQKCRVCGEETGERTNIVAPLGHEYKNGVCIRCGAPEPQENGGSSSAAPNYTVTGAETYETSVVDGRYIIAVPSEDAALNAVLGDLRAIKAQGADVVVFRTRSRESSLVIDEMLAMGTDVTPFVLSHNGGEAQLTINGAAHNELIH